jgi:hypothetical protein
MSINRMTNEALKEAWKTEPSERVQEMIRGVGGYADAGVPAALSREAAARSNDISNTLDMLIRYIPTEAITLYVAALAAEPVIEPVVPAYEAVQVYNAFLILTPLLVLIVYASKRATEGMRPFPTLKQWPWWEMVASLVAFAAWGLAVPGNPYANSPAGTAAAGLAVIAVSTLLTYLEPIALRWLKRWRAAK